MKLNNSSKIIVALYIITVIFWLSFIVSTKYTATLEGWKYQYLLKPFLIGMAVLPLVGGIFGLLNSVRWGGFKSVLGRATLGISLGLITWSGGMIIWNYYLFFTDIEVPYPSLADAIFIFSWPLWIYGLFKLSRVIGVKFALRNNSGKIILFLLATVAILLSIYLSFGLARNWSITWDGDWLKLFFDLFYPIVDVIILTLLIPTYWLSKKFLGGIYKMPILILFLGFLLNYIADVIFVFTTSNETYFNGHFVDFIYTTSMFALSLGLSMLNSNILDLEKKKL